MSETLGELLVESHSLTQLIVANDGEITPEIELQFQDFWPKIAAKLDGYYFFIKHLKHEAKYWRGEAEAYEKIEKTLLRTAEFFEDRIKNYMLSTETDKLSGEKVVWAVGDAPPSVEIYDELLIPAEYWVHTKAISKQRIRDDIKAGKDVPGASLRSTSKILRSKLNREAKHQLKEKE